MLQNNQTVYFTSGPLVQEATFDHYEGAICVLRSALGIVKVRKGRVFTAQEASEKGLLDNEADTRMLQSMRTALARPYYSQTSQTTLN